MSLFEPRVLKDPPLHSPLQTPVGLQLRVELRDSDPLVWRTIEISSGLNLDEFHLVLQGAMGWQNSHLHSFSDGSRAHKAFVSDIEIAVADEPAIMIAEREYRVDQLIQQPGDRLVYEYDYGDGWEHEVVVEKLLAHPPATPRCVGGGGGCPPEDSGGPHRANELAAWVRAGYDDRYDAEEHELYRQWLGEWSPDDFDVAAAEEHITFMLRSHLPLKPEFLTLLAGLPPLAGESIEEALAQPIWQGTAEDPELAPAQIAPFTTLLELIDDGVKLTAAKYLPPAVVKEWTSRLQLDTHILNGARELDSPLVYIRDLARTLGLVHIRSGVVKPTKKARELGDDGRKWAQHIAAALPLGKGEFDRHAGFAVLTAAGSGVSFQEWGNTTREFLEDLGWRNSAGIPISPYSETLAALTLLAEGPHGIRWEPPEIKHHAENLAPVARVAIKAAR